MVGVDLEWLRISIFLPEHGLLLVILNNNDNNNNKNPINGWTNKRKKEKLLAVHCFINFGGVNNCLYSLWCKHEFLHKNFSHIFQIIPPEKSQGHNVHGGRFFSWSPHRAVWLRVPLPLGFGHGGGEGFGLVPLEEGGATWLQVAGLGISDHRRGLNNGREWENSENAEAQCPVSSEYGRPRRGLDRLIIFYVFQLIFFAYLLNIYVV